MKIWCPDSLLRCNFRRPDSSTGSRLRWKVFTPRSMVCWSINIWGMMKRRKTSCSMLSPRFLSSKKNSYGPRSGWIVICHSSRDWLPLLVSKEFCSPGRFVRFIGWKSAVWCLVSPSPMNWLRVMRVFTRISPAFSIRCFKRNSRMRLCTISLGVPWKWKNTSSVTSCLVIWSEWTRC